MINFSNGLIGLSLLTGNNSFLGMSSGFAFETNAVRLAKAQFKTEPTVAPWQEPPSSIPESAQLSAIKRMPSIIDKLAGADSRLPEDIQTSFIAYKALERLRLLAEAGANRAASDAQRGQLQEVFARGLDDLRSFLAHAPSDVVNLAFSNPARRAESVALDAAISTKTVGEGLVATRNEALPGLAGDETLSVSISRFSASDTVTIDLSTTPQPPTLDSVAAALNAAIVAVPARDINGNIILDTNGDPKPEYEARFLVEKHDGKWGLTLSAPSYEQVSLDQVGAKDALMVATGQVALDAPATTRIMRFDDPAGAATQRTLGEVAAIDRLATERAALVPPPPPIGDNPPAEPRQVWAATTTTAIATDAAGNSYIVGTTAGDLGSNRLAGSEDLFLTKLDSEGKVVWQRTLGTAAAARGAAVSVAADGSIVVAGTVSGPFNGSLGTDSEMLVAKFDANGEEAFATTVRAVGEQEASAVAVGADGSIFVGGRTSTGGGDAFVARLSSTGMLQERRTIDGGGSDRVRALAIDGSGELLALTSTNGSAVLRRMDAEALSTDLGSLSLGSADARAIAVSSTGEIAVAGSASAALTGTQVNTLSSGRDGFVARIGADLSGASVTYLGSTGDDQVDSVTFMGGTLYVGGRTTGQLDGAARRGAVDGFIGRVDSASGAIQSVTQFGQTARRTEPVRIAAAVGGAGVTGALGFHRSVLNPVGSTNLVAQTSLRAGDEFALRVDGGREMKVAIRADDTLATLADRIRRLTGRNITVATPLVDGRNRLRIEAKPGHEVELIAGAEGKDALEKLGLAPSRIAAAPVRDDDAPRVQPGGSFGLGLSDALGVGTLEDAALALQKIKSAISMTQTAYRSLYWDDLKANLVNGFTPGAGGSPYMQKQLAMYQDALARLGGGVPASAGF